MVKNPCANAGDAGSIPESGISPGEGNGYPLQYSCLEKPMDRGAWRATVDGVAKELDTTEHIYTYILQSDGVHLYASVLSLRRTGVLIPVAS